MIIINILNVYYQVVIWLLKTLYMFMYNVLYVIVWYVKSYCLIWFIIYIIWLIIRVKWLLKTLYVVNVSYYIVLYNVLRVIA